IRLYPTLERKPHLQGTLASRKERGAAGEIDEAEPVRYALVHTGARGNARHISRGGRRRRRTRRVRHLQPVENVREVHPDREAHPLFEGEYAADAERLRRPALIAIIIVVGIRRAPL